MASIKALKRTAAAERLGEIRLIVDDVSQRIQNCTLNEAKARELVGNVRFQIKLLVPDQMATYDLLYSSRFERLIRQFIRGES